MSGYGAFGKIPAYGDFLRFGLPSDFVGPWDRWLQAGLVAARAALGAGWTERYLTAPIWRFGLAAGACGPSAIEGVLMASVDRVGRQFPFTLARAVAGGGDPVADHLGPAAVARFSDLEAIALDALEDDCTRDRLADRLASLDGSVAWTESRPAVKRFDGYLKIDVGSNAPDELAGAFAARLYRQPVVFSASTTGGQRWIVAEGLPAAHRMRDFFDLETGASP